MQLIVQSQPIKTCVTVKLTKLCDFQQTLFTITDTHIHEQNCRCISPSHLIAFNIQCWSQATSPDEIYEINVEAGVPIKGTSGVA